VVVHGDVQVCPAGAPRARRAVAVDPVPDAGAPPAPLDVQVEELPGAGPLVAHERHGRREAGQAREPQAALHGHHGGEREPEVPGEVERAAAREAEALDLPPSGAGEGPR
jgi:hypothetical protein